MPLRVAGTFTTYGRSLYSLSMTNTSAISSASELRRRFIQSQAAVPPLPVPPLDQTLSKYLRSVQPILSKNEFQGVKELVNDFQNSGLAEKLQILLEKRASSMDNWLTEWWLNVAYLDCRDSVVINVNPGVRLPTQKFNTTDEWLTYCTQMILAVTEYKKLLDDKTLPVDMLRGAELCMSQYYAILNSCRIPRFERDKIVNFYEESSDHISVAYRNQFYLVQVSSGKGNSLSFAEIKHQLASIVNNPIEESNASQPVGILSSLPRDDWSECYAKLESLPQNKISLDAIHRSIFLLCLDSPLASSTDDSLVCSNMLHGCGYAYNSANRYFDKTLQLIIGADGCCGLNYEHAPAEGPPVIGLMDYTYDYLKRHSDLAKSYPTTTTNLVPIHLPFNRYENIEVDIAKASQSLQERIDNLQTVAFSFNDFGKNLIKSHRLSPDALFQVSLQLAYYRIYHTTTATYESGSIRAFKQGRTDTIRSCSNESLHFCHLTADWLENGGDTSQSTDVVQALRDACKAHSAYTEAVVNAQGIDRHLLGLKLICQEQGWPVHPLFSSKQHSKALHYRLSTSQVPAKVNATLCFGPVVSDGYGVCYNPQESTIHVVVTAYNDCPDTDADKLAKSIASSLRMVKNLLEHQSLSKL